jgi:peptidoglycan hydrolase-like protein with peptidoglycan-binding domain
MSLTDKQAADLIAQAIPTEPKGVKMLAQLIGKLESSYGRRWSGVGAGSFNWGAITGTYQGQSFTYGDSRPDPDHPGQQIQYTTSFRKYPSDLEGIRDMVALIKNKYPLAYKAAVEGRFLDVSRGMYGYYLGTKPKEGAIADHQARIKQVLPSVVSIWGNVTAPFVDGPSLSPLPASGSCSLPVLRLGSEGLAVAAYQALRSLPITGQFGAAESDDAKAYQHARGLKADGIVGNITWHDLFTHLQELSHAS